MSASCEPCSTTCLSLQGKLRRGSHFGVHTSGFINGARIHQSTCHHQSPSAQSGNPHKDTNMWWHQLHTPSLALALHIKGVDLDGASPPCVPPIPLTPFTSVLTVQLHSRPTTTQPRGSLDGEQTKCPFRSPPLLPPPHHHTHIIIPVRPPSHQVST